MALPFAFSPFLFLPVVIITSLSACAETAQPPALRVLFLGNSYTYSNDMPAILQVLAADSGDSLDYEMEVPVRHEPSRSVLRPP